MSVGRKLQHGANLAPVLILLSLAALGSPAFGAVCDVDSDGDIDRLDLEAIFAARNQPASGADDPRDEDANGFITVLDGRVCALQCAVAQCVITEPLKAPVLAEVQTPGSLAEHVPRVGCHYWPTTRTSGFSFHPFGIRSACIVSKATIQRSM